MFQNVVLGAETLKTISKLPYNDYVELLPGLSTESFYCDADKTLFGEYNSLVDSASADEKLRLQLFIGTLSHKGRIDNHVHTRTRSVSELPLYESEVAIAKNDRSRVVLGDPINPELYKKIRREQNIYLADCSGYLNPPLDSPLRSPQRLSIGLGQSFNFRSWVKKFLEDAQNLTIQDPYIFHDDVVLKDVKYLLRSIPNARIPKKIVASLPDIGITGPNQADWAIARLDAPEAIQLEFVSKNEVMDRYLETQHFHITLGHAMGGVDRQGRARKQFDIVVTKK